jgi:pyruvate carboxylase subunit B
VEAPEGVGARALKQRFWIRGAGEGRVLEYEEGARGIRVRSGEREMAVDLSLKPGSPFFHLLIDGRSYPCSFQEVEHQVILNVRGREYRFEVLSERRKRIRDLGIADRREVRHKDIVAPIPGLVVDIEVEEGEEVDVGQGVVVMEAMKMENELRAQARGVVKEIKVAKGSPVDQGQVLVVIE